MTESRIPQQNLLSRVLKKKKNHNYSTNEGPRKGHPFLKGKTITRDQQDSEVSGLGFQNAFELPFFDLKKNRARNH